MAKSETSSDSRLSGAIVAGVITFLLGGVLALASLISQPVEIRNRAPDPESLQPGEIHIVRGEHIGRTAWRGKEQAWMSGQVDRMILTETELNQWSGERLVAPKSSDEEAPSGWTSRFRMTIAPFNFRIMEEGIQLFTELRFPGLFADAVFPYRVFGHLETVPGGVRFKPVSGTLGAAPLGAVPGVGRGFFHMVRTSFGQQVDLDPYREAYESLEGVEISRGQLVLLRDVED